ncbi:MAG: PilZ domain-containing protein [Candidatus Omnitrophica bacterium]|nr:PilZ domain-containing protein [Candidatus Omnitrophota bacterium]
MEQKRVHMRLEDFVAVELEDAAAQAHISIRTKTRDISAGGLKVYLHAKLLPGQRMNACLTLPDNGARLECRVKVVSSELIGVISDAGEQCLYQTGFTFERLPAAQKQEIIRYIYACRRKSQMARKKSGRT